MTNYLERIKIAKMHTNSNCKGTALYLAGIIEKDEPIDWKFAHEKITLSFIEQAGDLERISFSEDGSLVIFLPNIDQYGPNTRVTHAGIITNNPKQVARLGLSSYIYQRLKKMLKMSQFERKIYYMEKFGGEIERERKKVIEILQNHRKTKNPDLNNIFMIHRAGINGALCLDNLEFFYNVGGQAYSYQVSKEKPLAFFRRVNTVKPNSKTLKELLIEERLI